MASNSLLSMTGRQLLEVLVNELELPYTTTKNGSRRFCRSDVLEWAKRSLVVDGAVPSGMILRGSTYYANFRHRGMPIQQRLSKDFNEACELLAAIRHELNGPKARLINPVEVSAQKWTGRSRWMMVWRVLRGGQVRVRARSTGASLKKNAIIIAAKWEALLNSGGPEESFEVERRAIIAREQREIRRANNQLKLQQLGNELTSLLQENDT